MTLLRASSDRLMVLASSRVSPCALVFSTFSEPARSTRYSFPVRVCLVSLFSCLMQIRNTAWLRELCAFMSVGVLGGGGGAGGRLIINGYRKSVLKLKGEGVSDMLLTH